MRAYSVIGTPSTSSSAMYAAAVSVMPPSMSRAMPACRSCASACSSRRYWRCASLETMPRRSSFSATSWRTPSTLRDARNTVDEPPSPSISASSNGPIRVPGGACQPAFDSANATAAFAAESFGSTPAALASAASMRSMRERSAAMQFASR